MDFLYKMISFCRHSKKEYVFLFMFYGCMVLCLSTFGQTDRLEEKFVLPEIVKETSGLLFFNDRVITHNDSEAGAHLYEIDTLSGLVVRTITLSNATNVDWEDIDQDDTYIYVADIGNNHGNRQDLKIYRILKSEYLSSTQITAEVISFSYEDQTDFTPQPNNTNFDAEAMALYQDQIVIFSKNWIDLQTHAYIIPKTIGTHTAQKVSSFDAQGLITGASFRGEHFVLTGYDTMAVPFLVFGNENRPPSFDFFGGSAMRMELTGDLFLEQGSQIEGVCSITLDRWYLSREFASGVVGGNVVEFPQKLYEFTSAVFFLLSTNDVHVSKSIRIVPNPVEASFSIQQEDNPEEIKSVSIFNVHGQKVATFENSHPFNIASLSSGLYLAKIEFTSGKNAVKKLLKR